MVHKKIDCQIFALAHLGLITISGNDADNFLQGQCTNDIRQLTTQYSQLGSICTPKGRMMAIFRLIRYNNAINLQMPHSIIPSIMERLVKYKLRAKVEINNLSEQIAIIGLAASNTATLLEQVGISNYPELIIVHLLKSTFRLQILGPKSSIQILKLRFLELGAIEQSIDVWKLLDIRDGIPTLYPETVDTFVPQMTNLQLLGGVSFAKGCYTGQEVVARIEHLGSLKRRIFRAEVTTNNCPQPGEFLHSAGCDSSLGAGKIVDASLSRAGVYELLAVVDIETAQQGTVHLSANDGPQLRFLDLPT